MSNDIEDIQENKVEKLQTSADNPTRLNGLKIENQINDEAQDIRTILFKQINKSEADLDAFSVEENLLFKLNQLNISSCGLIQVPNATFYLKYLVVLNLNDNNLECLPKEVGNLCNLKTLRLRGNKLTSLPKSLMNIQQLNYLDLSCNKFSNVPDVLFYSLRFLTVLNLSCNKITKFNDPPGCLNKLIVLGLSNNLLIEVPVWIFDSLCQLQFLDISQNKISFDCEVVHFCRSGIFETLQLLNVENCNLNCKSLEILNFFNHLKVLYLGNQKYLNKLSKGKNYMGNLKSEIFKNLKEMKYLYLQNAQIATLPTDFGGFKNLEILDLSENLLSWLHEYFCDVIDLKILNLTSNQILFLPVNIGNLVNLTQIHLANNKLCQIPESFYNLSNIEYVDLYNNQIEKVDAAIFKLKNLKGIDLGLNCLHLLFNECNADDSELKMYWHFKDTFRKHFSYTDNRYDLQIPKSDNILDEASSDKLSNCSFDCDTSDLEDSFNMPFVTSYQEDENWDEEILFKDAGDELFDPNEPNIHQEPCKSWNLDFQNNFCPAKYHLSSVMKTYVNNYSMASKNDSIEDGQFDSD